MRLAHVASKLYPRWWRERYGDEFAALLEDARPGIGGAIDIAKGALWMRLTTPKQVFAMCAMIGLTVSAVAWFTQPAPAASRALLKMPAGDSPEQASQRLAAAAQPILSRSGLVTTIRILDLYQKEAQHLPLEDVIEQMRSDLTITAIENGLVKVEFRGDRPKAVAEYLAQSLRNAGFEVFEAATDPPAPSGVPRTMLMIGAPSGLLLGLAAAWWMHRRKKESAS